MLTAPILGHVGDGNFHCFVIMDPRDPDEVSAAKHFHERLARYCFYHSISFGRGSTYYSSSGSIVSHLKTFLRIEKMLKFLIAKGRIITSCWGGSGRHLKIFDRIIVAPPGFS